MQAVPEADQNGFEDFEDDVLCFTTQILGPARDGRGIPFRGFDH